MHTILDDIIDHGWYMSSKHVSPDFDLIFMVYWLSNVGQVSVNRSVSPLPYSLDSPHIDHGGCMSARHVSPDLDLIFRVY